VADWYSTRRTFQASDMAAEHGITSGISESGLSARGATTLAEFDQKSRSVKSLAAEGVVLAAASLTLYASVPLSAASWTAVHNNRKHEKRIRQTVEDRGNPE